MIGGYTHGIFDSDTSESSHGTKKTWIIDFNNGTLNATKGPSLLYNRRDFSCGKIIDNYGNVLIVAAGGLKAAKNTVEVLNMTIGNWVKGSLAADLIAFFY